MSLLTKQTEPGIGAKDSQIAKVLPAAYQHLSHIDASSIRPMFGRVILKDIHDDESYGSLVIPQTIEKKDRIRLGLIVAVGRGDKWLVCEQRGAYGAMRFKGFDGVDRREMQTKPGDKVWYSIRRESQIEIGGETYQLSDESQSVLAVVEE